MGLVHSVYRLIWNEICDALIYVTRRQERETACDITPYISAEQELLKLFLIRANVHGCSREDV